MSKTTLSAIWANAQKRPIEFGAVVAAALSLVGLLIYSILTLSSTTKAHDVASNLEGATSELTDNTSKSKTQAIIGVILSIVASLALLAVGFSPFEAAVLTSY